MLLFLSLFHAAGKLICRWTIDNGKCCNLRTNLWAVLRGLSSSLSFICVALLVTNRVIVLVDATRLIRRCLSFSQKFQVSAEGAVDHGQRLYKKSVFLKGVVYLAFVSIVVRFILQCQCLFSSYQWYYLAWITKPGGIIMYYSC